MSLRGNQPRNRRARRENRGAPAPVRTSSVDLPGPIAWLGNPKLFMIFAGIAGIAMVVGLAAGALTGNTTPSDGPMQANEAPDVPLTDGTVQPDATPEGPDTSSSDVQPAIQRYTEPPEMTIETDRTYTATIQTSKGELEVELYAQEAPQAVNAFVFLAQEGYYDGTPFMELVRDAEGDRFYAQAGDPTRTGLGTPGFSIPKELTDLPFERGYIGMGGSAENSNGGQFFISYGDYPALDGKYTIFGKVVSGLDVLDSLDLLDLTSGSLASASADEIESITIE